VVEPVGLIFNEDNYYLMVYSAKHDGTANYRVDRMDSVEVIDDDISVKALQLRNCVDCFTGQAFKMYGGQPVEITVQFDDKLIGVMFDKFGEDTKIKRLDRSTCEATVMVQVSPTFWGWLFQFGDQMRIISPYEIIEEYKKKTEKLIF